MTVNSVYELCNRKGYFTSGSCKQYEKMFEVVKEYDGEDHTYLEMVAVCIWMCSNDVDYLTILEDLEAL